MPKALIAGGGLAGLAAAAALGKSGFQVEVHEARPFLGGRATSYRLPAQPGEEAPVVDNCQHILLRCCTHLLDFYERLGVRDRIRFHREFYFVEPGGRVSTLQRGRLPAPAHFTGSFLKMACLGWADKLAIARGLLALRRERLSRKDLERITMADWLREKRQPARATERFWRQVLVSAVNEELDRMSAASAFQVFWLGFLERSDAYEMGVPDVPLSELISDQALAALPGVQIFRTSPVENIGAEGFLIGGQRRKADFYVSALPFERLRAAGLPAPELEHSPITGVHLWLDRPVTELPHASMVEGAMQWMFAKQGGRYVVFVVSASRHLTELSRAQVIELAMADLRRYFPAAAAAKLVRAHVAKEQRATLSAAPSSEAARRAIASPFPTLFLAGDWTATGWPSTMEGAVISGYRAAEAITQAAGEPHKFCILPPA